jgi:hypothetical protein
MRTRDKAPGKIKSMAIFIKPQFKPRALLNERENEDRARLKTIERVNMEQTD